MVMGGQVVVGTVRIGIGGDADGGLGGGTDRGGGRYGWENDGDRINTWEYTVANLILGTENNYPLAYSTGLELYHPIITMLRGHGGRLEKDIYIYIVINLSRTSKGK